MRNMYHITWWMAKFATKKIPCFPSPEPNPLWITTISGVWSRKLGLHTWSNGATHKTLWQSSFNFERILCNSKREKWGALNMNWDPSSQKNMPHFLWSLSHWKNPCFLSEWILLDRTMQCSFFHLGPIFYRDRVGVHLRTSDLNARYHELYTPKRVVPFYQPKSQNKKRLQGKL